MLQSFRYSHPNVFSPECFLEKEGRSAERTPRACVFGFGETSNLLKRAAVLFLLLAGTFGWPLPFFPSILSHSR